MAGSPVKVKTRGGEELKVHFKGQGDSFEAVWLEGSTAVAYQARLHEEAV
jgi:hypothetical protein